MKRVARKPESKKSVAGVNEMPVDGARTNQHPASNIQQPAPERTVNGIPVSKLPAEVQGLIGYEMTDQGIAEKNARRVDSKGRPHSGVEVLVNEGFDQQIRRRMSAEDYEDSSDPLLDAKNKYAVPGFRYRGLSPTVIRKKGMRNWEAVLDTKGDPVTAGNLILARMPEERAERRNKKYRDEGNSLAALARERSQQDREKVIRDSGTEGIRILGANETVTDSGDPNHPISIGVHSSRGDYRADAAA